MRIITNKEYKVNINKLLEYGFIKDNNIYRYNKYINEEFKVIVEYKDNIMTSKLIDILFKDEYLQADSNIVGKYSNNIKNAYEEILNDIKEKCFIKEKFKEKQAKEIIKYIKNHYNCELEYLWEKYDDNAIVRNKNNNKWFGVFMKINANKLGISQDKKIEIIDLMYYKNRVDEIIDNKSIFLGYHMNKKSWITIILDGKISTNKIIKLIDISYNISINK